MNPFDLVKNFQNIQAKVGEIQSKVQHITVRGSAGGDMVSVEMNGQFQVTKISISPEVVDPADIRMLEDLILAALSDGMAKIREKLKEEMSSITGGLDLPPG
ncbi:MAG: YbaB/EbfC family nucleoid-associated protein, partial [Spirochaetales bacterium]